MTQVTVHEYAGALRERYLGADRKRKGRMLEEFCQTTGLHRKAAIRLLHRGVRWAPAPRKRGRPRRYGPEVSEVLVRVWEMADRMCGKLLVAVLPSLVDSLERHGELRLPPRVRQDLLAMSAATLDRRLGRWRRGLGRQPKRQAPASTALKREIPIRTWSEWQGVPPGAVQADLVLHCGESSEGFFLTTLTAVDVASGWTELQPVWGMGMTRVGGALQRLSLRLPFLLRELHTDNGGEFINRGLRDWCQRQGVRFSRGRSYRKNDQAYVEQRNWLSVRRLVGYDRYHSRAAFGALERLYSLLRLQFNYFRPVRKLVDKERQGARVVKRYDTPRTPYQRLLDSGILDQRAQQRLEREFLAINPAQLQREIEQALGHLWDCMDSSKRARAG